MKNRLAGISLVLAAAAAVFLLFWPVYSSSSGSGKPRLTLLEVNGYWPLVPMTFPVALALVPLLLPRQAVRIAAAVLMGLFVVVAGMSIGLLYLPAAIFMLLAACVDGSAKFRDALP